MSDKPNGEAPRKPRIVIEFTGPGMADCTMAPDPDVTPGMLYGAAWLLEAGARETRLRQLMSAGGGLVGAPASLGELLDQLGVKRPAG
jgi:hypothetical protein